MPEELKQPGATPPKESGPADISSTPEGQLAGSPAEMGRPFPMDKIGFGKTTIADWFKAYHISKEVGEKILAVLDAEITFSGRFGPKSDWRASEGAPVFDSPAGAAKLKSPDNLEGPHSNLSMRVKDMVARAASIAEMLASMNDFSGEKQAEALANLYMNLGRLTTEPFTGEAGSGAPSLQPEEPKPTQE